MIRTTTNTSQAEQSSALGLNEGVRTYHQTYREIADRHVVETDVLEQLRSNLAQLEDLHGRMKFMMTEVSYLLKKI
ncbi:MAG TPA: hypothetical protein VM432_14125 [Bdellovibrionales bacterium]|jgi:hypothetical protein|nr:hypothetical protein [Bdellovibrionales bacterium]